MTYEELLRKAPPQDSLEFLTYLRDNNEVIFESQEWLVIENFKYHEKFAPWYTAFHKPKDEVHQWYDDIDELWYHEDWATWGWLKRGSDAQSVPGRFHIHLIKPTGI